MGQIVLSIIQSQNCVVSPAIFRTCGKSPPHSKNDQLNMKSATGKLSVPFVSTILDTSVPFIRTEIKPHKADRLSKEEQRSVIIDVNLHHTQVSRRFSQAASPPAWSCRRSLTSLGEEYRKNPNSDSALLEFLQSLKFCSSFFIDELQCPEWELWRLLE